MKFPRPEVRSAIPVEWRYFGCRETSSSSISRGHQQRRQRRCLSHRLEAHPLRRRPPPSHRLAHLLLLLLQPLLLVLVLVVVVGLVLVVRAAVLLRIRLRLPGLPPPTTHLRPRALVVDRQRRQRSIRHQYQQQRRRHQRHPRQRLPGQQLPHQCQCLRQSVPQLQRLAARGQVRVPVGRAPRAPPLVLETSVKKTRTGKHGTPFDCNGGVAPWRTPVRKQCFTEMAELRKAHCTPATSSRSAAGSWPRPAAGTRSVRILILQFRGTYVPLIDVPAAKQFWCANLRIRM